MKNLKIKMAMFEANLKQWEVARIIGIREDTFSRKMRDELPDYEQERIVSLIRQHRDGDQRDK